MYECVDEDLEELGYKAAALGFFVDDVQAAYTTNCACCITPSVVDYIHAISMEGYMCRLFHMFYR